MSLIYDTLNSSASDSGSKIPSFCARPENPPGGAERQRGQTKESLMSEANQTKESLMSVANKDDVVAFSREGKNGFKAILYFLECFENGKFGVQRCIKL